MTLLLIASATFVLLDTFVLQKPLVVLVNTPAQTYTGVGDIRVSISTLRTADTTAHLADILLPDPSCLRSAFANNTYGRNITQPTSAIAREHNALLAVNGDFHGFRPGGLIIRDGILYRDTPRKSPDNKTLLIDRSGNLSIITEGAIPGPALVRDGAWQTFSFGPVLVQDGKPILHATRLAKNIHPRTAIGQLGSLHYLLIVVDGRTPDSKGMSLAQLSQLFLERGATTAYNLDGGGSSAMYFDGALVNRPSSGLYVGERPVSDILYIPCTP